MIGGGGEKRTLRLVALYADMCNVTGDAGTLAHKIECSIVTALKSAGIPRRLPSHG